MSEFDVRFDKHEQFKSIRFSDSTFHGLTIADRLIINPHDNRVEICDCEYDIDKDQGYVVIANLEHAKLLVKAINQAIEFGWLE